MQLAPAADPIDLVPFERRLNGCGAEPVAVALSGGGDSLALLLLAKRWADRAGRRLVALTVDHGLQPQGAAWANRAAERARRLGVAHRTLRWEGAKPKTGLPAGARAARHCLLAEATRAVGARVILLGHTADDSVEAGVMRTLGSTVPTPREWSPSPVWPEGRGVFLLRPLLGVRRADLRRWLCDGGERWIEDPANDDPRFARTVARRQLSVGGAAKAPEATRTSALIPNDIAFGEGGEFTLQRDAFDGVEIAEAKQTLSVLCLCAAGGSRPPRGDALGRLLGRLTAPGDFTAVLAGARFEGRGARLLVCREVGELRRSSRANAELPDGESVFDGRFLMSAPASGWRVRELRGLAKHLPPSERVRLAKLPAAVRGGLPVVVGPDAQPTCPTLALSPRIGSNSLTRERFLAALGAVPNEASIQRVAKPSWDA